MKERRSSDLSGSLLVAHPNLLDPNFRRAVVLIVSHDEEEGAFGLVLNRNTGRTVREVVRDPIMGELGVLPVYHGGPVSSDRLAFVAMRWDAVDGVITAQVHLNLEEAKSLMKSPTAHLWAFAGYSGWSPGQLENELEQKTWIVEPPRREFVSPVVCAEAWPTIVRGYGPWFRLMASAPDDPSLN